MAVGQLAQNNLFTYQERILLSTSSVSSPAAVDEYRIAVDVAVLLRPNREPIDIILPNEQRYRGFTDRIEARSADSFLWRGRLVGAEGEGQAILTVRRGHVAGLLSFPGKSYEVIPDAAGEGVARLLELDGKRFAGSGGAVPPVPMTRAPAVTLSDHDPVIDVLVVYTPAARQAAGGVPQIETLIQDAVDVTNAAYDNSEVHQQIVLIGMEEVAYDETNVSMPTQLSWLTFDPGVAALRGIYSADMVALISEEPGGFCGYAWIMRNVSPDFANWAFSVTHRPCAVGNLIFAHELGHNMGLEHDPAHADVPPEQASYPYSFGHFVDGVFRTVMSYPDGCSLGCPVVPYFSNPNVSYSGFPTGIENERNNALTLNNTGPVVEAFSEGLGAGDDPCSDLCENPTLFTTASYQSGNLGTAPTCHETTASLSGANCGNFATGRTFRVNDVAVNCTGGNISLPSVRNGGYCFQASAGDFSWAYFTTW